MKRLHIVFIVLTALLIQSCHSSKKATTGNRELKASEIKSKVVIKNKVPARTINTKGIPAGIVVDFAETLQGVPYKYGSADKSKGFDCSGFIYYVFTHFKIPVPRSSVDFTNAGKEVLLADSKRGDIILFTGSNANSGVVGHMGIITGNDKGRISFIHAASGNGAGVMISGMGNYFVERFVKVIRVFSVF
jgi:cell wall-associated NlpC family hydrolase